MSNLSDRIRVSRCPYAAAVIVAAGSGTRFGGDKLLAELCGAPVLVHTLRVFQRSPMIGEIVLVVRAEAMPRMTVLCQEHGFDKVTAVVAGGKTRAESCFAGVSAVSPEVGIIAIHDGARPLVTEKIIDDALWNAHLHNAAVPAVPVRDTIKRAHGSIVSDTPDRSELFAVQTPQCFAADVIRTALADALLNAPQITDDCMAVERLGGQIWLTEGSEENIKITTPLDLALAEIILTRRSDL